MPNTPAAQGGTPSPATGHQLAQLNVALLAAPLDSPQLADFVAALPDVNRLADESPGFVWRLQEDPDDPYATVTPSAFGPGHIVTLSVWRDADSLWQFVYRSGHMAFLRRRHEWFADPGGPSQVLWWIPAGTIPTEHEGAARLAHLRAHGPTAHAFTFRHRFPAPGADPSGHAALEPDTAAAATTAG
jgi:hypothetical protein